MNNAHIYRTTRIYLLLAGGLSAILGLVVLTGWHVHNQALVQVQPSFVPMQYNTALGFLLSGVGLLLVAQGRLWTAVISALGAGTIGLLTLSQYLTGVDLGIDQLLMEHYITVETSHLGRMAPNTALCFALVGVAIAGLCDDRLTRSVGLVGMLVVALGLAAFAGYVGGLETAYGWGELTRMAVHTALGFLVLGLGLGAFSWRESDIDNTRWLALLVGVGSAVLSLLLWQALTAQWQGTRSQMPAVILAVGLAMSFLLALTTHFGYTGRSRSRELALANTALKTEMAERQRAEKALCELNESLEAKVAARTEEVNERAGELERANAELSRFNSLAVGREHTMIELKGEVNSLRAELGRDPVYELSFVGEENRVG